MLDSLEPGGQHHAEGQIRIAGRVRSPVLHPHGALIARFMGWHPDQVRAARMRPGDERWSFESGHQALVGIDPLIGHQSDLRSMVQQSGDEPLAGDGQVVFVV